MVSIRSKPWMVETPKTSEFTIIGRLAKEFNIKRD